MHLVSQLLIKLRP